MKVTDEMIQAALNAPTGGDDGSYCFEYLTEPEGNDPDWKAVGPFPSGYHPRWKSDDWRWHIVKTMLEAHSAVIDAGNTNDRPIPTYRSALVTELQRHKWAH